MQTAMQEFDKAIKCLAIELPEQVWKDISGKWEELKKSINKNNVIIHSDFVSPETNRHVCSICGKDTSETENDYMCGNDHLACVISKVNK